MPMIVLIGLGAGLAAAFLFGSAANGALAARFFLSLLSMLPIFLAGLGWGIQTALIATLAGAAVIGLFAGPAAAAAWFATQGLPVLVLCHFAYLNRSAAGPVGPAAGSAHPSSPPAASIEWYPLGRIVAIATVFGGALAALSLSLLLLGTDFRDLKQKTVAALDGFFKKFPEIGPQALDDAGLARIADMVLAVLPGATAFAWVAILLLNLWLAARITFASGRLARPWPDLAAITFPPGMGLGLAAAVSGSFLGGMAGLVASAFTGALLCAYVLLGLAIVHYVTRGNAARGFILWGIYFALLLFNTYAVLALAVIGLSEPFSPLKRRFDQRPKPPSGNHPNT